MNACLECNAATKNPKFCNRSCSAKYSNARAPKRRPEGNCASCSTAITSGYKYCATCYPVSKATTEAAQRPVSRNTKQIGDRCEMEVLYRLTGAGLTVCVPVLGEDNRFDLVVSENGRFLSIQCKSGRLEGGKVVFGAVSNHFHRGGKARSYRGAVDLFGVYCPDNGKLYFVSPMTVPPSVGYLRVDQPRNKQTKGIRWAADFEWQPGVTLASLEAKR